MKQVYKITYPTQKIYIGKDSIGSFRYFGSPDMNVINEDFSSLPKAVQMDYTIRKEILWESETCSEQELSKKEVEFIRQYQSNNPAIGYNRWPLYKTQHSETSSTGWRIGVDGCKGGWFFVAYRQGHFKIGIVVSLDKIFNILADIAEVVIDIPIGLNEKGSSPRTCDVLARQALKPRGSTVFPAPVRPCLTAANHSEACNISEQLTGKKLSKQAFNICGKIKEVDELLVRCPDLRKIVKEAHPELGFCMLNGGMPLLTKKKKSEGIEERLTLLCSHLDFAENAYHQAITNYPRKTLAKDDIVDALMCLCISLAPPERRKTVPDNSSEDNLGLEMAMHYAESY